LGVVESKSDTDLDKYYIDEARVEALHRAAISLFSDLSLDGVLQRIVQSARELVDARYAALGVPDSKGGLETFITEGMSGQEKSQIPHPPIGEGLIGEMMRSGESVRIPEISDHPASIGFPEGHPEMHSFLGVPIMAYKRPIGQIYLTDKVDGYQFNKNDQQLIEMLAAFSAAAIENAGLYNQVLDSELELTQRNEELELINSLGGAVSSTMEIESLLEVMLDRAMELFEAPAGEVYLHERAENNFKLALHRGEIDDPFWQQAQFRVGEGLIGRVVEGKKPIWAESGEFQGLSGQNILGSGYRALVVVPLIGRGKVVGILSMAFDGDRNLNDRDVGLLGAVGAGIGTAIENARLARQGRRLAVLEERVRIGMDLHDGIIQSIYAVGLTLEYTRTLLEENPSDAKEGVEKAIQGLDATIGDLRTYILDLQPSKIQSRALDEAILSLIREFKANTLIEVDLSIEEEIRERLDRNVASVFFHITQEALANVAKHAQASRVWVHIRTLGDDIALQVIDNGQGFDSESAPQRLGHGLSNMEERAYQIGAAFELASNPGEGTTITIRLPKESAYLG
jgi:signal transduction histidine kinase